MYILCVYIKKKRMNIEQIENLTKEQLDALPADKRAALESLLSELKERKLNYPLLDYKRLPHQQEISDAVGAREGGLPKHKYILFI